MTWREGVIGAFSILFLWVIGIALVQFPGGMAKYLLRKTAQLGLWIAGHCLWCYLTWTHSRMWTPVGKITYYEWLQYSAQDPEKAIHTYTPWAILLYRIIGLIWLGGSFYITILLLQTWIQGD